MGWEPKVVGELIHVERDNGDVVIDAMTTGDLFDAGSTDRLVTLVLQVGDAEGERLRLALDSVTRERVCWLRAARGDDGTHLLLAGDDPDVVCLAIGF